MTSNVARALYWIPRVLGIVVAVFLGTFALDVFGESGSAAETIGAFLIHLIPAFSIVVVLGLAWRWQRLGALLFLGLGVSYFVWTGGRFPWTTYLVVSGPLMLTGGLFLLGRRRRRAGRAGV